jgi:hypothetical protein
LAEGEADSGWPQEALNMARKLFTSKASRTSAQINQQAESEVASADMIPTSRTKS